MDSINIRRKKKKAACGCGFGKQNHFHFGNWENQEAFEQIKKNMNNGKKYFGVYTLTNIIHFNPTKTKGKFKLDSESGRFLFPNGKKSMNVSSIDEVKDVFKNQLINLVESIEDSVEDDYGNVITNDWVLPGYNSRSLAGTKLYNPRRNVNIPSQLKAMQNKKYLKSELTRLTPRYMELNENINPSNIRQLQHNENLNQSLGLRIRNKGGLPSKGKIYKYEADPSHAAYVRNLKELGEIVVDRSIVIPQDTTECGICYEVFTSTESSCVLNCGHWFHCKCIDKWRRTKDAPWLATLHNECPLCRTPIDVIKANQFGKKKLRRKKKSSKVVKRKKKSIRRKKKSSKVSKKVTNSIRRKIKLLVARRKKSKSTKSLTKQINKLKKKLKILVKVKNG